MLIKNASKECQAFLATIRSQLRHDTFLDHKKLKKAAEQAVGAPIIVEYKDLSYAEGFVIFRPKDDEFSVGHFSITIAKGMSIARQLFTFSHEIGHILESFHFEISNGVVVNAFLKNPRNNYKKIYHRYNYYEEQICDDIATQLLCPEDRLIHFMKNEKWVYQLRLFEEFYPEKYWFFRIVDVFKILQKNLRFS